MLVEFVVPSETISPTSPQCGRSRRHLDCGRRNGRSRREGDGAGWRDLTTWIQIVQHVSECLGMHQPMLDNHVPVLFRRLALFERTVDAFTHARVVTLNLDGGGPIRGLIFRQASHWGVDAELEQL